MAYAEAHQVPLANGPLAIRWTNLAEYRMGKLEQPGTWADLSAGGPRLLSALCDFIWAAQDFAPPKRPKFATPEDIVDQITAENLGPVAEALMACMRKDSPDAKKKASPSGLGPESTSASPVPNSTDSPPATTPSS